ncbi:hypothetical protein, conserved [Eimeria tenella]|uniref:Uncharacterized protein n=1 Tax=Eimeria tenella TaxID=5802 RepID=U6L182_EIMTE|nr:hypothetical protein, conserved [Eimeria tenella]CDJ42364.1 hypothetical protein, conserved [Eimeria tenella]|eukprot:XP_013233114.1 hypothetical protein, conserved [Eimeria tenella]
MALSPSAKNILSWAAVAIVGAAVPLGLSLLQVSMCDIHEEALLQHEQSNKLREEIKNIQRKQI